jgi:hypothetical protein
MKNEISGAARLQISQPFREAPSRVNPRGLKIAPCKIRRFAGVPFIRKIPRFEEIVRTKKNMTSFTLLVVSTSYGFSSPRRDVIIPAPAVKIDYHPAPSPHKAPAHIDFRSPDAQVPPQWP